MIDSSLLITRSIILEPPSKIWARNFSHSIRWRCPQKKLSLLPAEKLCKRTKFLASHTCFYHPICFGIIVLLFLCSSLSRQQGFIIRASGSGAARRVGWTFAPGALPLSVVFTALRALFGFNAVCGGNADIRCGSGMK